MKVLLANKFFFRRGGAEVVYFALLDGLTARGVEVVPFSMRHPRNLASPFEEHFVRERDYRGEHGAGGSIALGLSMISSREAVKKIGRLCDQERPDVAHFHNIYHQLTPSILSEVNKRRIPAVMTLHDYKVVCPTYRLFRAGEICEQCVGGHFHRAVATRCAEGSFWRSLLLAAESTWHHARDSYRKNVDLFLAPSRFLREKAISGGLSPDRVRHFPNFVPSLPEAPPIVHGKPYVLFAGRLSREKGLLTLLAAFRASRGRGDLLVAGEGPLKIELERAAAEDARVVPLGMLDEVEIVRYLRGSKAVVVPSLWYENAPMIVLEALGLGVPVIASELGGLPEYVVEGKGGCLVPAGDVEALSAVLDRALEDARFAGSVGAGESVEAPDHDRFIERTLGVYEEISA